MKAITRSVDVEAIQVPDYVGNSDSKTTYEEFIAWSRANGFKFTIQGNGNDETVRFYNDEWGDYQIVKSGEWIVRDDDGFIGYTPAEFRRHFALEPEAIAA